MTAIGLRRRKRQSTLRTFPFAAVMGGSQFTPASLANLALWIDPSDTTTMFQSNAGTTTVTDGSVCGFAGDKSGAAFNLTSLADDTTRPTWNNNSGLPYLNFDGSNDILTRGASLGLYAASAVSIFAAVRGNPAAAAVLVSEGQSGTTNTTYWLRANGTTAANGSAFIRNDAGTSEAGDTPTETNAFNNTDKVIGWTDTTAVIQWYTNGVAGGSGSYTRSGVHTSERFSIGGAYRVATTNFWTARLYGLVIVKRVLTAGEIAQVTTYLGAKMGLSL